MTSICTCSLCQDPACKLVTKTFEIPAPAPVRISPEVRKTLLWALREAPGCGVPSVEDRLRAAIAFVEALP